MNIFEKILNEDRALYHQEELILEMTELLCSVMQDNGISKAELARRVGKSKGYITQCLSGEQNLTLRTVSDLFLALGYRLQTGALPTADQKSKQMVRLYPVGGWAIERCTPTVKVDYSAEISETSLTELAQIGVAA